MSEPKWIAFTKHEKTGKTDKYTVSNKEHGSIIGEIKFYGAWRKYCFFPAPNCVFESDCLTDIKTMLVTLTTAWKAEQQQKKQSKL